MPARSSFASTSTFVPPQSATPTVRKNFFKSCVKALKKPLAPKSSPTFTSANPIVSESTSRRTSTPSSKYPIIPIIVLTDIYDKPRPRRPICSAALPSIPISSLLNPIAEYSEAPFQFDDSSFTPPPEERLSAQSFESAMSSASTGSNYWSDESDSTMEDACPSEDEDEDCSMDAEVGSLYQFDGHSLCSRYESEDEEIDFGFGDDFVDLATLRAPLPRKQFWQGLLPVDHGDMLRRWVVEKSYLEKVGSSWDF